MDYQPEFKPWPKISRMKSGVGVTITEKIDGTNACIIIEQGKLTGVQSRQRLISPGDDNFGFAFWVYDNEEALLGLGDGYHFGEWAGPGIQKNPHNLPEKRFYLFNTFRPVESLPEGVVYQVPVLYQGDYSSEAVERIIYELKSGGSKITPDGTTSNKGKAEGIILYFHDTRSYLKWTFEYQDGKWKGTTP